MHFLVLVAAAILGSAWGGAPPCDLATVVMNESGIEMVHASDERMTSGGVIVSGGLDMTLPLVSAHLGLSGIVSRDYRGQYAQTFNITEFQTLGAWKTVSLEDSLLNMFPKVGPTTLREKTVLDLGAGIGDLVPYLNNEVNRKTTPHRAIGIDLWYWPEIQIPDGKNAEAMRAYLERHYKAGYLRRGSALDLSEYEPASADFVLSHMLWSEFKEEGRDQMLREAWRVLKSGGEIRFASDYVKVCRPSYPSHRLAAHVAEVIESISKGSGCSWGGALFRTGSLYRFLSPRELRDVGMIRRLDDYRLVTHAFDHRQFFDLVHRRSGRNVGGLYTYTADYDVITVVIRKECP